MRLALAWMRCGVADHGLSGSGSSDFPTLAPKSRLGKSPIASAGLSKRPDLDDSRVNAPVQAQGARLLDVLNANAKDFAKQLPGLVRRTMVQLAGQSLPQPVMLGVGMFRLARHQCDARAAGKVIYPLPRIWCDY